MVGEAIERVAAQLGKSWESWDGATCRFRPATNFQCSDNRDGGGVGTIIDRVVSRNEAKSGRVNYSDVYTIN